MCGRLSMPLAYNSVIGYCITYNSLHYKDSPTPKLATNRSANPVQIQFKSSSNPVQIQFR
ncbi:hypothetical protein ACN38_g6100, partial [Penicillium nordicum]